MEAMTKIEIDFAQLRDTLYLERLADVEAERSGIITRTHPELLHIERMLEERKQRKLDAARKWLDGLEVAYERRTQSEEHTAWEEWGEERAELRSAMLDDAFAKRRKLDREKRNMDRPKDGEPSLPFISPYVFGQLLTCTSWHRRTLTLPRAAPSPRRAPPAPKARRVRRRCLDRKRNRVGTASPGPAHGRSGQRARRRVNLDRHGAHGRQSFPSFFSSVRY